MPTLKKCYSFWESFRQTPYQGFIPELQWGDFHSPRTPMKSAAQILQISRNVLGRHCISLHIV